MKLSKGIFYTRTPNTTAGIKLHKGLAYISVWSVAVTGVDATVESPTAIVTVVGIAPVVFVAILEYYCIYLVALEYSIDELDLVYSLSPLSLVYAVEEVEKCTR